MSRHTHRARLDTRGESQRAGMESEFERGGIEKGPHGRAVRACLSRRPRCGEPEGDSCGVTCAVFAGATGFNYWISAGASSAAPSSDK